MKVKFRQILSITFLFTLLNLISVEHLHATKAYTWNGSVDSTWTIAGNWTEDAGGNEPVNPDPSTGTGAAFLIDGTYTNAPVISASPAGFNMEDLLVFGNSLMQVRGGTVNFSTDAAVYDGSELIITGGEVNIAGSLYLFDDASSITVAGGELNVSGDIIFGNNLTRPDGTDGATEINLSSGSISCNNLVYDATTGDTHTLNISGGTVNVSADIRSDGEDVVINISNTGTLDIGDDLNMTGGNDLLTMTNGILLIDGDWNNSGTTNLSGGQVRFTGTGFQSISNANGTETFYDLFILKSFSTVTLNDSIIITDRMRLINGVVDGNGNSVTFIDNALVFNASSISYIDGPINKIGNDAFTFPTGSGSDFKPIGITAPTTNTSMFRAQYFRTNPNPLFDLLNKVTSIIRVSQSEYWQLDRLIDSSGAAVTLQWGANSGVGDPSTLKVVRWDSDDDEWKDLGNGGTTGDATSGTITSSSSITEFSPFTLGSSTNTNPLPVELMEFNPFVLGDQVVLNWTTTSEINNNRFILEKTLDGKNIEQVASIPSKAEGGNSTEHLYYSFQDRIDFKKVAYYRLIQIDHDGSDTEYPFQAVYLKSQGIDNNSEVLVYPNPIEGNHFYLDYVSDKTLDFALYNSSGSKVPFSSIKVDEDSYRFSFMNTATDGILYLSILDQKSGERISSQKLFVR